MELSVSDSPMPSPDIPGLANGVNAIERLAGRLAAHRFWIKPG